MPLSPAYNPATSFANDETNQVAGRSTVRTVALDTELANAASSINGLKTNIEKIQRDDGKVKDFIVEPYALAEQTRSLITSRGTPRGLWAAGVVYAVGDVVQQASVAYICYTAHTASAPFTANGFWIAISGDGSAAASAAAASASQGAAAASATTATTQATNAAASATNASTSATNAGSSATAAGNSATAAASSASAAATSASQAADSFDSFDDRYLGAKASAPTLDNDGNALVTGALYFNTTTGLMYVRTAAPAWSPVSIASSGFIATLLDDADAAAARGTLAAAASGANSDITSLTALASINGGQLAGLRNKIINGNPTINQRGASGASTAYAAGAYFLDRWKAGAGGATLSFATSNNVTTITVTAGTIVQVVEGLNLASGTHILSWSGTAQGRIDGGAYGATGRTATATGGTNMTVEFNTGTLSLVQLEPGSVATPFEHRPYGVELALCQRYYQQLNSSGPNLMGCYGRSATLVESFAKEHIVPMRSAPTLAVSGTFVFFDGVTNAAATSAGLTNSTNQLFTMSWNTSGAQTRGAGNIYASAANSYIALSAEL